MKRNSNREICGNCGYSETYTFLGSIYCGVCGTEQNICRVCAEDINLGATLRKEIDENSCFCCRSCMQLHELEQYEVREDMIGPGCH